MESTHITATSAVAGMRGISKDDFIAMWAERSECTFEQFEAMGIEAQPCDCGKGYCDGWMLVVREGEDHSLDWMMTPD